MRFRVDMSCQRISVDGQPAVAVRGKFDLQFLAILTIGGHYSARRGANAALMSARLHAMGLPVELLSAKSWHRIVDRLTLALQLLHDAPILRYAPRGKTTGPWWLDLPTGTVIELHPVQTSLLPLEPSLSASRSGAPRLARSLRDDDVLRLLAALKRATELAWNGLLHDAVAELSAEGVWHGESFELKALRLLRCADIEITLSRYTDARVHLDAAADAVRGEACEVLMHPHLQVVRQRCDYAEKPQQNYVRVGDALRRLTQGWSTAACQTDAAALGEQLNLLGLCERRAVEAGFGNPDPEGFNQRMTRLLEASHGAMFCYLLVQNHEKVQYVCANLAYAHQRIAALAGPAHWRLAVEWHAMSFDFSEGFQQSENSAWEFIYIGELWLASADARVAFRQAELRASWRNHDPATLDFYLAACTLADTLSDPRQKAYAWLNRFRFAEHTRRVHERDEAWGVLADHLALHPNIHKLILDEGYRLPRLNLSPFREAPSIKQTSL